MITVAGLSVVMTNQRSNYLGDLPRKLTLSFWLSTNKCIKKDFSSQQTNFGTYYSRWFYNICSKLTSRFSTTAVIISGVVTSNSITMKMKNLFTISQLPRDSNDRSPLFNFQVKQNAITLPLLNLTNTNIFFCKLVNIICDCCCNKFERAVTSSLTDISIYQSKSISHPLYMDDKYLRMYEFIHLKSIE